MYSHNFNDFEPIDFLSFAKELNNSFDNFKANPSAIERNILGRIYYASFLYVREWAKKHLDYIPNPKRDHTQLPNFLQKYGPFDNLTNKQISDDLRKLKRLRQQSDYYVELPPKESIDFSKWIFEDIPFAFRLANNIIETFENLNYY